MSTTPSRVLASLATFVFATMASVAAQAPRPMPRLEKTATGTRLFVDDAPFLVLGAQAHNSSASTLAALGSFWNGLETLGANTAEVPVYWELVEPEPGRFDFALVDGLLREARARHVRLVLLWFASWKNGEMHYAPAWVKRDHATYRRVIGPGGDERDILSPLSTAARDADAKAFAALMRHIGEVDAADRTVILVQVENETGLMGADRDYGDESSRLFRSAVPRELGAYVAANKDSLSASLATAWAIAGRRTTGTWTEMFGELDAEAFSAWHIARYVDAVAAAGKAAYSLPMYVNAWLINPGDERAGRWPSGGPTHHVLDIWKAGAPHIDLLAPDIYQPYVEREMEPYVRPDNPLLVPELALQPHFAAFPFAVFARFNGIGVAPFGLERDGAQAPDAGLVEYARSYRVLAPLLPLIAERQGRGTLHAIVQDLDPKQVVSIGQRIALVVGFPGRFDPEGPIGRGLAIELGPDDLVVGGVNLDIVVRDRLAPLGDPHQWATRQPVVSIEEGTFVAGRWVANRRLNGDERWTRLGPEGGILRLRLSTH